VVDGLILRCLDMCLGRSLDGLWVHHVGDGQGLPWLDDGDDFGGCSVLCLDLGNWVVRVRG